MLFGRNVPPEIWHDPGETSRRQSRRSEDISPTRVRPAPGRGDAVQEEHGESSHQGGHGLSRDELSKPAREREIVPTRQNNRVSRFILANSRSDMRLPSDEYFPSGPQGATTKHRNLYQYSNNQITASKHDEPSAYPFSSSEEAGKLAKHERSATKRSVHFESERENAHGLLSKIQSAITGKFSPKGGRPVKPALRNKSHSASSKRHSEVSSPSKILADPKDDLAAMSKSTILDKGKGEPTVLDEPRIEDGNHQHAPAPKVKSTAGNKPTYKDKGKAVALNASGLDPDTSPFYASDSGDDPTVERRLDYNEKGRGRSTVASAPTHADLSSPQWESISEDSPVPGTKYISRDQGKGKTVAVEGSSRNRNVQTDLLALEDDCVIDDSPS